MKQVCDKDEIQVNIYNSSCINYHKSVNRQWQPASSVGRPQQSHGFFITADCLKAACATVPLQEQEIMCHTPSGRLVVWLGQSPENIESVNQPLFHDHVSFSRVNYGRTFRFDSCVTHRPYRYNLRTHTVWQSVVGSVRRSNAPQPRWICGGWGLWAGSVPVLTRVRGLTALPGRCGLLTLTRLTSPGAVHQSSSVSQSQPFKQLTK